MTPDNPDLNPARDSNSEHAKRTKMRRENSLDMNCWIFGVQVSPAQPTGGRRRRTVDDDPDERRQRFLERNRAAASRCRQKRKLWVSSLEKKAEELTSMNVSLTVSRHAALFTAQRCLVIQNQLLAQRIQWC